MSRQCFLRCLLDSHAPVKLPHNVEVFIGRSKVTKIKDQSCSRQQISLKADCEECQVEIKVLGINPSGLDGFALKRNGVYKVKHGSRIEILLNNYVHVIEFDPPPDKELTKNNNKRKLDEEKHETSPRKKSKTQSELEQSTNIKEAMNNVWEDVDKGEVYIFTAKGVKSSEKIAAFDMDGTLIKTKSGKVHPVDTNDWQIAFPQASQKLIEKLNDGYKIVILTNQSPIGNGRVKIEDFKKKIEGIVTKLNVPIQVYMATGKGFYRKPAPGMWKVLAEQKNDNLPINMNASFYCGDAAGRTANWAPGRKKDHSMADILLAENLGLKFYTPEQFFLGHSIANIPMSKPEFNPKELKSEPFNEALISKEKEINMATSITKTIRKPDIYHGYYFRFAELRTESREQDICSLCRNIELRKTKIVNMLLVLVGFPGSGKSFLAKEIVKRSGNKYNIVCRDEMGTWQKCASEASKLLQLLVLVGFPGSGKSFLAKEIVKRSGNKYNIVCRDEMGTWQKCASEASKLLQQGKSVVVDSTNPDKESRARWTSLAKNMNVQCRCARMMTTKAHALHNNKFREIMKMKHILVNEIIINTYKSKFVEPTVSEGFQEIIQVKFNPSFDDKEAENMYRMYLLEK